MTATNCPSCGALVEFRSSASIMAVCGYCQSTLVRHDMDLEKIGKMADLLPDRSPIQLGTQGVYGRAQFNVVGRIQQRYGQGVWNEWYVYFDDQRTGWLGDFQGQCTITFPAEYPKDIPTADAIKIGGRVIIDGSPYQVTNIETARCVAGAGELPFKVGPGYEAQVVDLRGAGNSFATLDYSEDPPRIFVGAEVDRATLKFTGLREEDQQDDGTQVANIQAKSFNCTWCGAPQTVHAPGQSESLVCGSCGSVIDLTDPNLRVLWTFRAAKKAEPRIPLGSRGKLFDADYEVLGFMRRMTKVDYATYEWSEYLLHSWKAGFRWLTEYDGHWNFVRSLTQNPQGASILSSNSISYGGKLYKHFQNAAAEVSYVIGEFYWRIEQGEKVAAHDFVSPPFILSKEQTEREISWSQGEYVEPDAVWSAFKLEDDPPPRFGVSASQPSPHKAKLVPTWGLFGAFFVAAMLMQGFFLLISANKPVYQRTFHFDARGTPIGTEDEGFVPVETSGSTATFKTVTTDVFPLTGRTSNVVLKSQSNLDNNWLFVGLTLVEKDTGAVVRIGRELSYYHGYDGGESWSEGGSSDEVSLPSVPSGNYYLTVDAEADPRNSQAVDYRLTVNRDVPYSTNFWITILLLSLYPIVAWWRHRRFEQRRWAESDHPWGGGADSSDSVDSDG